MANHRNIKTYSKPNRNKKTPSSLKKKQLKKVQKLNTFLLIFIIILLLKPWNWVLVSNLLLEINNLYTIIREWR